ncbi:MAG: hypothetical protein EAZ41_04070 [Sphingobacteriia bacterium]|nr:MAG: hypothetical protein EAZ41_04070 [Sphingobacteriia bacterium]
MKPIFFSTCYFLVSSIITWLFIERGKLLYFSQTQMLLSCAIAGTKWGIQILAALIFLKTEKWIFIYKIGFTCLIGSCILLPYCFFESIRTIEKSFLFSLITAVLVMIFMYFKVVTSLQLSKKWFWGWIYCLTIAITLQMVVVFKIV